MHAPVPRIAEGHRLLTVQERAGLRHVMDVGRRGDHRVHETRPGIDADVGLHPKVVSRPQELPPQPLAEPYVTLPRHTAPVIQPVARPHANDGTAVGWPPASCPAIRHWAECAHEEP